MVLHAPGTNAQSPIYKKAVEIIHLAHHISLYLRQDLEKLQSNGKENPHIYFTGDIVQQSISLAPQILKAEGEVFQDQKFKYADSVRRLSNRLYKNCRRLERASSNGREFIPLLIKELQRFKKLQKTWHLTL